MVYLTRRYRFAAAHRLHSDALSEEENQSVYGKCNNPYGHGHNYVLEVTVAGPVDPATGMVMELGFLDGTVEREVLERFDHKHLNLDVDAFRNLVPTAENLCIEIYKLLRTNLEVSNGARSARLERIRLEETNSNFFEYEGQ
ncbi:MAG TPA: 6-carboxytetrahydropterin synthase [Terriglobia bacterium]|jgi:6-pyruvoyltetrahydropterin/6-carboxytetrahydropterin synthase|nr:6-carboxytetrahydropterin synthase [Terriglobia bacterium]